MDWIKRNIIPIAVLIGISLVGLLVYWIYSSFPPKSFTMATGREGGGYHQTAEAYRKIAVERGFDLQIVPTAGSLEALDMLERGEVDAAFIQGGTALDADPDELKSLASIYFEPVWVFYRTDIKSAKPLTGLDQLDGLKIAIGEAGSGTQVLARTLLQDNGITAENATLVEVPLHDAVDLLTAGDVDVVFAVISPESATVQTLLRNRDVDLMNMARVDAYHAMYPYLARIVLPRGAIDLEDNLPTEDKNMIATAANIVVREEFHPDLMRLLTLAMVFTHREGGLFEERLEFPNFAYVDLPIHPEELAYGERLRSGETTLDKTLPFWAAALIDRYYLFLLPILFIALPLLGRSSLLVEFYMRNQINRWYKKIRAIELQADSMSLDELDATIAELNEMESRVPEEVNVSLGHMRNVYFLRSHIEKVIEYLEADRAALVAEQSAQEEQEPTDFATTTEAD
ncbi:MAG: TAXI family TRAP transporter solute-binding subunit [Chloroflexota bacterium]|nr:TAXI family TRAP transporter solute-binding subunit [Chloroflexota bacterium]